MTRRNSSRSHGGADEHFLSNRNQSCSHLSARTSRSTSIFFCETTLCRGPNVQVTFILHTVKNDTLGSFGQGTISGLPFYVKSQCQKSASLFFGFNSCILSVLSSSDMPTMCTEFRLLSEFQVHLLSFLFEFVLLLL